MADLEATAGRRLPRGASPSASSPSRAARTSRCAARAAWSGDVDVWRGVRDPKRPTTRRRRVVERSSLSSPRLALARPPRRSPSPRPAPPPRTHQVVTSSSTPAPSPRYPPRASRASTRSPPSRSSSVDRRRVPRQVHRGAPPGWTSAAAAHRARVAAFVLAAIAGAVAAHGWYAALTRAAALARAPSRPGCLARSRAAPASRARGTSYARSGNRRHARALRRCINTRDEARGASANEPGSREFEMRSRRHYTRVFVDGAGVSSVLPLASTAILTAR